MEKKIQNDELTHQIDNIHSDLESQNSETTITHENNNEIHNLDLQLKKTLTRDIHDTKVTVGEADLNDFPEGGRGWLVILGCFCISIMTYGMVNAYGVFQTYYATILFPTHSSIVLSLIGAVQTSLIYMVAPFAVPLSYALSPRVTCAFGGSLMVISFFLLPQCTQFYQVFLCQGVCYGLGGGIMFPPTLQSPYEWFKTKRALANACSVFGTCIGGIIWPILFKHMEKKNGFQWTCRTIGFLYIPLVIAVCSLLQQPLDEKFIKSMPNKQFLSISKFSIDNIKNIDKSYKKLMKEWVIVLKNWRFNLLLFSNALGMLGSYCGIFFLDYFAVKLSPNSTVSEYIVVLYNAFGGPGRLVSCILADQFGRLNVLLVFLFFSFAFPLILWMPSISQESLSLFAIFTSAWGVALAGFFAIFPVCMGQLFGINGSEARVGLFLLTSGPGPLIGTVIASSFIPTESHDVLKIINSFYGLSGFSGGIMFLCFLTCLWLRLSVSTKLMVYV